MSKWKILNKEKFYSDEFISDTNTFVILSRGIKHLIYTYKLNNTIIGRTISYFPNNSKKFVTKCYKRL